MSLSQFVVGGVKRFKSDTQIAEERNSKSLLLDKATTGETLNIINKHEKDNGIKFFEDGHYYIDENGKRFRISTTGWKSLFCIPFDMENALNMKFKVHTVNASHQKISGSVEDNGLDRKECINKMRAKAQFGTEMHAKIEHYVNQQGNGNYLGMPVEFRLALMLGKEFTDKQYNCATQMLRAEDNYFREGWTPYRVEWSIYNTKLQKAGQIDMVLKRRGVNGEDEYMVLDWKTSSSGNVHKAANWMYKQMFYPIQHLRNCPATEYKLQMSDYANTLITEYGLNVVEIRAEVLYPNKALGETIASRPLLEEVNSMNHVWACHLEHEALIAKWEKNEIRSTLFPDSTAPIFYTAKA